AMRPGLAAGKFDEREVETKVTQKGPNPFAALNMPMGSGGPGNGGMQMEGMDQLSSLFEQMSPRKQKNVKLRISEARRVLFEEEVESLIDMEKIKLEALERAQQHGIIFIDEFDKIA